MTVSKHSSYITIYSEAMAPSPTKVGLEINIPKEEENVVDNPVSYFGIKVNVLKWE